MVLMSFFVATIVMLALLLVLKAFNRATYRRGRAAMLRELAESLDGVMASGLDHASGVWCGMPVRISLGTFSISYEVTLPYAVIPYEALLARHGSEELRVRLDRLELSVVGERLLGSVPRENGLIESIVTVLQRVPLAAEVYALRRFASQELLVAVEAARTSYELDTLLIQLATWFRFSPEMSEAIEVMTMRDPDFERRVRSRAREWMGMLAGH